MAITQTPKVTYSEGTSNPTLSGKGAQIPIFIGITGNVSPAEGIKKFKNYAECRKTVANGGIGTDTTTNPLLAVLKDFFEEARKINADDIGIPYVYVIDLGTGKTTSETPVLNTTAFTDAMELAKSKRDVEVEIYVGFKKADTAATILSVMNSAYNSINTDSKDGNPRTAYFTVSDMNDTELIDLTNKTTPSGSPVYINKSRIGLTEPLLYGKTLAKICTTHYSEEPGFTDYRSVDAGTFIERTPAEELALQNAGIIFNRDERAGQKIHPRINLAVSTAFAENEDERPNDCLLHMRRNVDQLIREAFEIAYSQLKRNETEINLSFLQSDLDVLVENKISQGYMLEGTQILVQESEVNPYDLKIEGVAVPVNSTLLIDFSMYIEQPNAIVRGGN